MPVYDAFVLMFFLVRMYYISYAHYYYTNRNSIEIQRQMDILDRKLIYYNTRTNIQ
jgi:uncharacterized membrane protein